jgi:hypothetical protein
MATPTIEEKLLGPSAAAAGIAAAMARTSRTTLTAEDAAALTGLPLLLAGRGLMHLARSSPARLEVTEAGVLRFAFAGVPRLAPSRLARARERLRAAWVAHAAPLVELGAWGIAGVVLVATGSGLMSLVEFLPHPHRTDADLVELLGAGVLITGLVVGAPVLALALAAAAFVAAAHDSGSRLLRALVALPAALVLARGLAGVMGDALGRRWLGRQLRGFFLGSDARVPASADPAGDGLDDERRLVALLRARAGVVGLGDLAGTFGWDLDETWRELPRILVDYDGSVVLDDELRLALRFDRFGPGADAAVAPARPTVAARPRFFACAGWFAAIALSLVAVTTVVGLARADAPAFPGPNQTALAMIARRPTKLFDRIDDVARDGFGLWPLVVAVAPLGVRLVVHRRRLRQRDRRVRLLRALDFALADRRPPRPADDPAGAAFTLADAARLGVAVDDDGWSFPTLDASQRAAAALRAGRRASPSSSARVVFSA